MDVRELQETIGGEWPAEVREACETVTGLLAKDHHRPAKKVVDEQAARGGDAAWHPWFLTAGRWADACQLFKQAQGDIRLNQTVETVRRALARLDRALTLNEKYREVQFERGKLRDLLLEQQVQDHLNGLGRYLSDLQGIDLPPENQEEAERILKATWDRAARIREMDPLQRFRAAVDTVLSRAEQQAQLRDLAWPPKEKPKPDPVLAELAEMWKKRAGFAEGLPGGVHERVKGMLRWLEENREKPPGAWELSSELAGLEGAWSRAVADLGTDIENRLGDYEARVGSDEATAPLRARLAAARGGEGPEPLAALQTALGTLPAPPDPTRLQELLEEARRQATRKLPAKLESSRNVLEATMTAAADALEAGIAKAWVPQEDLLRSALQALQATWKGWLEESREQARALGERISRDLREDAALQDAEPLKKALATLQSMDPEALLDDFEPGLVQVQNEYRSAAQSLREMHAKIGARQRELRELLRGLSGSFEGTGLLADGENRALQGFLKVLSSPLAPEDEGRLDQADALASRLQAQLEAAATELDRDGAALADEARRLLELSDLPPGLAEEIEKTTEPSSGTLAERASLLEDRRRRLEEAPGRIKAYREARQGLEKVRARVQEVLSDPWLEEQVRDLPSTDLSEEDQRGIRELSEKARAAAAARKAVEAAVESADRVAWEQLPAATAAIVEKLRAAAAASEASRMAHEAAFKRFQASRDPLRSRAEGLVSLPGVQAETREQVGRATKLLQLDSADTSQQIRAAFLQMGQAKGVLDSLERRYEERVGGLQKDAERLLRKLSRQRLDGLRLPRISAQVRTAHAEACKKLQDAVSGAKPDPAKLGTALQQGDAAQKGVPRNWLPALAVGAFGMLIGGVTYANLAQRTVAFPYAPGYEVVSVRLAGGDAAAGVVPQAGQVRLPFWFGRNYEAVWGPAGAGDSTALPPVAVKLRPWPLSVPPQDIPVQATHRRRMDGFLGETVLQDEDGGGIAANPAPGDDPTDG